MWTLRFFGVRRSTTVLHLNIQGLCNKLEQLEVLVGELGVEVLLLSEHWQGEGQLGLCGIGDMRLVSSFCRKTKKRGGVAIYVKNGNGYTVNRVDSLDNLCVESVIECCGVEIVETGTIFVALYRVPNSDNTVHSDFLDIFARILYQVYSTNKNIIIGGILILIF